MVFKMIGGSSFSFGTYNNFNTSLLIEGILHISVTGTVIFNFLNMVVMSMFNGISSMGDGFGSNSFNGSGSVGTTFSPDGGGAIGCYGVVEALFLLVSVKYSLFLNFFL